MALTMQSRSAHIEVGSAADANVEAPHARHVEQRLIRSRVLRVARHFHRQSLHHPLGSVALIDHDALQGANSRVGKCIEMYVTVEEPDAKYFGALVENEVRRHFSRREFLKRQLARRRVHEGSGRRLVDG